MKPDTTINKLFEQIAQKHLFIQTLDTQHSDRSDFHDVAVWCIKSALQAAYDAGLAAAQATATTSKGKK